MSKQAIQDTLNLTEEEIAILNRFSEKEIDMMLRTENFSYLWTRVEQLRRQQEEEEIKRLEEAARKQEEREAEQERKRLEERKKQGKGVAKLPVEHFHKKKTAIPKAKSKKSIRKGVYFRAKIEVRLPFGKVNMTRLVSVPVPTNIKGETRKAYIDKRIRYLFKKKHKGECTVLKWNQYYHKTSANKQSSKIIF